jgi:uncharacterized LabA/DUF88 family protein
LAVLTACYIDGFNLYHAVDALAEPYLKWADLSKLARSYLREGDQLVRTAFFTAFNTWDAPKRKRHVAYVNAVQAYGAEPILSRFDKVQKHCHRTDQFCPIREEKQTDVAIGIEMLRDCYDRGIERIVLITADSDQVPAVKAIKQRFPEIIVFLVAPPKRLGNAQELGRSCDGVTEITRQRLIDCQLPHTVRDASGKFIAARPAQYGNRHTN